MHIYIYIYIHLSPYQLISMTKGLGSAFESLGDRSSGNGQQDGSAVAARVCFASYRSTL